MSHINLLPDEHILLEIRRHPFIIFLDLLLFGFLLVIPLLVYGFLYIANIAISASPLLYTITVLIASMYYLYVWLFTFHSLMDYVLDVWIITSQRIIDMEQKGLFAISLSEQDIHRIQDMTVEINGILPTLLNYGNVYIQTSGKKERFMFKQVRNPRQVIEIISHLIEELEIHGPKKDLL